ncbi:hypothetical protein M501DRAFT_939296 [Patellaria atrata CBS 101060]|uniref:Transcription factor CBF/NF-Y/archaeal histone domain-containing protein n=1 Tax=Patellaria atrata CBS 101060 TaxID=1346257 RepID=A0A9P4VKM6_9PEZI|nr:hypothetical protein M501DRAFT_939296 [Patellaria atrata CBS 101060]
MAATPPKKGDVEPALNSPEDSEPHMDREGQDTQAQANTYEFEVKEQDRWLPIANVQKRVTCIMSSSRSPQSDSPPEQNGPRGSRDQSISDANIRNFAPVARIMKMALPDNAKIAKEAKECMQECVSEFISFITSEASEKCQQEKRKTVNGEDILFAMASLGFENYGEALKIYLSRYRETLLANQNKQPGGPAIYLSKSDPNAPPHAAESANHQLLSEMDGNDHGDGPFGYAVGHHNGNGTAEF